MPLKLQVVTRISAKSGPGEDGGQLTRNERQFALPILVELAIVGLAIASIDRDGPFGGQGALVRLTAADQVRSGGFGT